MRTLPPFAELVAFEAVARHGSFTRAAAELCLTQSAVSHRVRRLEAHFGQRLLHRLNPGLALTEAGAALLPEATAALDTLARLGRPASRRLRVAAGASLCQCWLAGRLDGFLARRPGLSVELLPVASDAPALPEADLRILWVADGDDAPGPGQAPLFTERVFPVCSPTLLPGGRPHAEPAPLAQMTLLHKAAHGRGEWSWPVWFAHLGLAAPAPRRGRGELHFADIGLVLAAAADGAGVALGRSLLVHDALAAGRLTLPVRGFVPMVSGKKHVARWRRSRDGDPDLAAFVGWLSEQAARTLAATDALLGALLRGQLQPQTGTTVTRGQRAA